MPPGTGFAFIRSGINRLQKPNRTINETERLAILRSLRILDTPAEARFDRITRLAARVFDMPTVLISLVDENRQWFKSRLGLELTETPRDISFCGHAIHEDEIFVVKDTLQDPRFADNPLVTTSPKIRFYAGCPLKTSHGVRLGTLCLIDYKPRTLNSADLAVLQDLAELVERELGLLDVSTSAGRLFDSELQLSMILDNIADGVVSIDENHNIISFNTAAEKIFAYETREVIGKHISLLTPGLSLQNTDQDDRHLPQGIFNQPAGKTTRLHGLRKNGDSFPLELILHKNSHDRAGFLTGIFRDLSALEESRGALDASEAAIRELYEITSAANHTYEQRVNALLKLGCQRYGLENGIFCRIHNETYTVIESVSPGNTIPKGSQFLLGNTYCRITIDATGPIAFEHAGNSEWAKHPCYEAFKLEAYLGTRVTVSGMPYGTLNFSSTNPLKKQITQADKEFLQLMARWIGQELERELADALLYSTTTLQKAILDSANYTIISTNVDGIIMTFNKGAERMLGYKAEEVIHKLTPAILHDPEEVNRHARALSNELGINIRPGFEVFIAKARDGEADENEWTYIRKDGSRFPVMLSVTGLKNEKDEISGYLGIGYDISDRKAAELALQRNHELLNSITWAQSQFIQDADSNAVFDQLLSALLKLTNSEYGFIGEVLYTGDNQPYLRSYALTDISWNDEARDLYNSTMRSGMEFYNQNTLFGTVLVTGKPIISNDPANDPRSGGLPNGHPPLTAFMGIPIYHGNRMVGMIGIANRPGGFDESLLNFLQPLLSTFANLLDAIHNDRLRRQTNADLNRFKNVLDNTLDMIFMFEPDSFRFVYLNKGAVEGMGYTRDELLLMTPLDITPLYTEAEYRNLATPLITSTEKSITFETLHRHKDGTDYPVEIFLQFVAERDGTGLFIAIVHDITERSKIDRMKREFVSTVSHELRTPLTSILGSLGLISGSTEDLSPEQSRHLLDIAYNNSQRLVRLINDILDIEKIEYGKMKFEPSAQDLAQMIMQSVESNAGLTEQYDVSFVITDMATSVYVNVDSDRLIQVMTNLLSNAAKFSDNGSQVIISSETRGDYIRVNVTDHGNGIPPEFHDKIFMKFSQVDSSDSRRMGGTGLGLSITKAIIEKMGGSIGFKTHRHAGTTFYFDLPIFDPERMQ